MITILPLNNNYKRNYTYPLAFLGYEKTFVMLKPDSFERKLNTAIIDEIKASHLEILKSWEGVAPKAKLEGNYSQYKGKSFYNEWIGFLRSGKVNAMIVGGDDAVSKINTLKSHIRGKYAPNQKRFNLVHSSDDIEAAKKEIANFFDKEA